MVNHRSILLNISLTQKEIFIMYSPILQFIFVVGILHGLIMLFVAMKQKRNTSKSQIGRSIALMIACGAALLITII